MIDGINVNTEEREAAEVLLEAEFSLAQFGNTSFEHETEMDTYANNFYNVAHANALAMSNNEKTNHNYASGYENSHASTLNSNSNKNTGNYHSNFANIGSYSPKNTGGIGLKNPGTAAGHGHNKLLNNQVNWKNSNTAHTSANGGYYILKKNNLTKVNVGKNSNHSHSQSHGSNLNNPADNLLRDFSTLAWDEADRMKLHNLLNSTGKNNSKQQREKESRENFTKNYANASLAGWKGKYGQ